jgi:hypothetical protein
MLNPGLAGTKTHHDCAKGIKPPAEDTTTDAPTANPKLQKTKDTDQDTC